MRGSLTAFSMGAALEDDALADLSPAGINLSDTGRDGYLALLHGSNGRRGDFERVSPPSGLAPSDVLIGFTNALAPPRTPRF